MNEEKIDLIEYLPKTIFTNTKECLLNIGADDLYISLSYIAETFNNAKIEYSHTIPRFISKNQEIRTYPSSANENIRVWECGDIKMFCGGTHVKNTSEIGKIRLKRENKGAGKERVETYLVEAN